MTIRHFALGASLLAVTGVAHAQFAGFINHGLVGVGRLSSSLFDKAGDGQQDTLGGFSAMAIDPASLTHDGGTVRGRLVGLPDRGFGDGATDYRPRMELFDFTITPYYGDAPVGQGQITFTNVDTVLFTYSEADTVRFFTGFDAGNTVNPVVPQSPAGSIGGGRRSLDAEGLVLAPGGGYWVTDEYGPGLFRFDAQAALLDTILPPAALVPKQGAFPGTLNFTGNAAPASGRRNNRGLEGLSLTPDGKRLVAFLQSPNIQDGGAGNLGRNTRVLQFDAEAGSPTFGRVVAEHIYQLTLNGNAAGTRHTPVSEVLAVNSSTFIALERDGIGLGTPPGTAPTYKKLVLFSTEGASNLAGSAHDLEKGAPGQLPLPATGTALPDGLAPVTRQDFVDLLDPVQLAKFGLNANAEYDANTLSEKWEALSLIPLNDAANPDDYLLLVGNDNDFFAPVTYHNGVPVGTNDVAVDLMLLAYRVTLPGVGAPRPANAAPTVAFTLPTGDSYASGPLPLTVTVNDPDGIVVKAEFFDGDLLLGERTMFPWTHEIADPELDQHHYRVVVTDNSGATGEVAKMVTVTAGNLAPAIAITAPAPGTTAAAPYTLALRADVTDEDGYVTVVDYYAGGLKLGSSSVAPFSFNFANAPVGTHVLTAVATDNLGLSTTSAPVNLTVTTAVTKALTLQVLHASDLEGGVDAIADAPNFAAIMDKFSAEMPNTLILSAGDNYIPGPFFSAAGDPALRNPLKEANTAYFGAADANDTREGPGRADILIMNLIGFDASALGNHEFDAGTALIRENLGVTLSGSNYRWLGTQFPYLSANLDFSKDGSLNPISTLNGALENTAFRTSPAQLATAAATPKIAPSCIIVRDGEKIGVVGATTPLLAQISSPGSTTVKAPGAGSNDMAALAQILQPVIDGLLRLGVNKVVLVSHLQQLALERQLVTLLRGVDISIAGGSDSILADATDVLRMGDSAVDTYPVLTQNADGEPVAILSTDGQFKYVGRLVVGFDAAGRLLPASIEAQVSGAYKTDEAGVQAVWGAGNDAFAEGTRGRRVKAITEAVLGVVTAKDARVFGRSQVFLEGRRTAVRTEETNLGNLTAEANLWRARQTDPEVSLSLKNGGGIRAEVGFVDGFTGELLPTAANSLSGKETGEISQLDIENSLRFNNTLSLLTLTAQQLRDAMEWGVAASSATATPGQFPQVAGMAFSFDHSRPPMTYTRNEAGAVTGIATPGERLRNLVAFRGDGTLDLVVEDGQLVGDPNRTFKLVTLNFLAGGGDTYYPLTLGTGRVDLVPAGTPLTFDTDGGEQKALADYLAAIQSYSTTETPVADDEQIQNLAHRDDTVTAPQLVGLVLDAGGVTIRLQTLPGKSYTIDAAESVTGPFTPTGLGAVGDGRVREILDAANAAMKFYRANK